MKKQIVFLLLMSCFLKLHAHNFINILSTDTHTVFLSGNGKIYSSGLNLYGQLGVGYTSDYENFSEVECNAYFVSIAVGEAHNLALDSNGFLWGWGSNVYDQLSRNIKSDNERLNISTSPVKLSNEKWLKIYASGNLSFGIKEDGTLWGWGKTSHVETGQWRGVMNQINHPNNLQWKEISLHYDYFVATDIQGDLWTWGCINQEGGYSFFDYYKKEKSSYYEVNKLLNIKDVDKVQISQYNISQTANHKINIYGYSVAKPQNIYRDFVYDISDSNRSSYRSFYYKQEEKSREGDKVYTGYFINEQSVMHTIISWGNPSGAIKKLCYTLIIRKDKIILWTNGERFIIDKNNIRNIWTSNVIFLEDTNNKIYIIGYNDYNRLGINKPEEEFLYCEPFVFLKEEF